MTARSGAASVVELVLVCTLFALVSAGAARYAGAQRRLSDAQRDRVRWAELVRTTAVVLGAEVRYLAASDLGGAGGDSVRVRAFRGGGVVCAGDGSSLWIRYEGVRQPEPEKDSLLLLYHDTTAVAALASVARSDSCGGSLRATLESPAANPRGHALVFEAGTYMIAGGALRYRRGGAGRQPLTETLLDDGSGLVLDSLAFSIRLAPGRGLASGLRAPAVSIQAISLNRLVRHE